VNLSVPQHRRGFSLIEMLVVMVIVGALTTLGLTVFGNSAANARRTAMDQFTAAVEQARTSAITRRKPVILAIAPPISDSADQTTRFGLFEVDALPDRGDPIEARQVQRWNQLPGGVVFFPGSVETLRNVLDEDKVQLKWKEGASQAMVYAFAFNPRGGLAWPTGSDPVAVKIGSGLHRAGQPVATPNGGHSSLRIGRVVARPWRLDG
jgi:prepilin-type N-terminal cleavage/methylation domain-containing protein